MERQWATGAARVAAGVALPLAALQLDLDVFRAGDEELHDVGVDKPRFLEREAEPHEVVAHVVGVAAGAEGEVVGPAGAGRGLPLLQMDDRPRGLGRWRAPGRQVRRLANYGLKDGKIFDFISRTTATSGQELSYLTPLFKILSFN